MYTSDVQIAKNMCSKENGENCVSRVYAGIYKWVSLEKTQEHFERVRAVRERLLHAQSAIEL